MLNLGIGINPGVSNTLPSGVPNGYLKAVFFDKEGNVQAAESQVKFLQTSVSTWQTMELSFTASQNGYLQVYVANKSDQEVFFDDLEVAHTPTLIAQENHYYPYGMNMVGIEKQGMPHNRFQFNAQTERETAFNLHWDETPFRRYDAQIGRFHGVDALASQFAGITPYQYGFNNPVMFNDPSGLESVYMNDDAYNLLIGMLNNSPNDASTEWNNDNEGHFIRQGGFEDEGAAGSPDQDLQRTVSYEQNSSSQNNNCCGWWKRLKESYPVQFLIGVGTEVGNNLRGAGNAIINSLDPSKVTLPFAGPGGPGYNHPDLLDETKRVVETITQTGGNLIELGQKAWEGDGQAAGMLTTQAIMFGAFKRGRFTRRQRRRFFQEMWENNNAAKRGRLIEDTYRNSRYKNFENVGALENGFFPAVDFYNANKRLAVSVKSINAARGSRFLQNLIDNIDDLARIRTNGSMTGRWRSTPVFHVVKVRLDIFVPRGYKKVNLVDVVNHASSLNIPYRIIEIKLTIMATWTCLYAHSKSLKVVEDLLTELMKDIPHNIRYGIEYSSKPEDVRVNQDIPNFLMIGQGHPEWITVNYNNLSKLENWSKVISQKLSSYVVVTISESISMYSYLGIYNSGQKIREIDSGNTNNEGLDIDGINVGKKLSFENNISIDLFNFKLLTEYTKNLGLDIHFDPSSIKWTVIEANINKSQEDEVFESTIKALKTKPWWKFWQS